MTTEMPYSAVIAKLLATAAVTDLVGQRVYPRIAPPTALERDDGETTFNPYIVVRRPAGNNITHRLARRDSFRKTPLTVYCMACDHLTACRVADVVMDALDPTASDQTGSQTWGAYSVDHCEVMDHYDASTDPQLADEIGFPIEAIDINLFHTC